MSMKHSIDTMGNQTRDLPACSAVPQPAAPLRAPTYIKARCNNNVSEYDKIKIIVPTEKRNLSIFTSNLSVLNETGRSAFHIFIACSSLNVSNTLRYSLSTVKNER